MLILFSLFSIPPTISDSIVTFWRTSPKLIIMFHEITLHIVHANYVPKLSYMRISMPWFFNENKNMLSVTSSQSGNYPNTFPTSKNVFQKALKMYVVEHRV